MKKNNQTRWGLLTDEEMKIVEMLSSSEPLLGMEILATMTMGRIAMILDKCVFHYSTTSAKNAAQSGPNMACKFLVLNSFFKMDLSHHGFDTTRIATKGIWQSTSVQAEEFHRKPDKDKILIWFVYDYSPWFCRNMEIKREMILL